MKIAVIGGIGSGKSEVVKVAREMGLLCLSADEINAELLADKDYIEKLSLIFPNVVAHGIVDKKKLAGEIFSDRKKREQLNALAHPAIMERIVECKEDPCIVEIPLILESGCANIFDEIILMDAPKKIRIDRLKGRGLSPKDAKKTMKAQVSNSKLKKIATKIIDNSGDLNTLQQVSRDVLEAITSRS